MGFEARTGDTILDDPAEVIVLVPVDKRVVNAHVGVSTDQDQSVRSQTFEQDLELRAEEARIAALLDDVVVLGHAEGCSDLGARVTLEKMDVFRSVQLTAEIDEVAAMRLLEEHDGHLALAGLLDQCRCTIHDLLVAGHERESGTLLTRGGATLDIDHDQDWPPLDEPSRGVDGRAPPRARSGIGPPPAAAISSSRPRAAAADVSVTQAGLGSWKSGDPHATRIPVGWDRGASPTEPRRRPTLRRSTRTLWRLVRQRVHRSPPHVRPGADRRLRGSSCSGLRPEQLLCKLG